MDVPVTCNKRECLTIWGRSALDKVDQRESHRKTWSSQGCRWRGVLICFIYIHNDVLGDLRWVSWLPTISSSGRTLSMKLNYGFTGEQKEVLCHLAVYWVNIELPSSSFSRCANWPRLIASRGVRLLLFRLIASRRGRMCFEASRASTSSSRQLSSTTFLSWNPRFARSGLEASKVSPSFILSYSKVMRLGWSTSRLITPSVLTLLESRIQNVSCRRAPCNSQVKESLRILRENL